LRSTVKRRRECIARGACPAARSRPGCAGRARSALLRRSGTPPVRPRSHSPTCGDSPAAAWRQGRVANRSARRTNAPPGRCWRHAGPHFVTPRGLRPLRCICRVLVIGLLAWFATRPSRHAGVFQGQAAVRDCGGRALEPGRQSSARKTRRRGQNPAGGGSASQLGAWSASNCAWKRHGVAFPAEEKWGPSLPPTSTPQMRFAGRRERDRPTQPGRLRAAGQTRRAVRPTFPPPRRG
jgi:hypothetical protein